MATGLQPAMGNKIHNALFPMRVLKHTQILTVATVQIGKPSVATQLSPAH